jgi:hypothetical protein
MPQVGGNAVVARGDSSGTGFQKDFIKYADGTLICTGKNTVRSSATVGSGSGLGNVTFAASFNGLNPTVTQGIEKSYGSGCGVGFEGLSLTSMTQYLTPLTSSATSRDLVVSHIAIGRWF